ncbi:formyltransferase family protein [Alphaproteobacteria bacterium]|nr:formyltransferase family protein [Alphaproteobacteria bacterium]
MNKKKLILLINQKIGYRVLKFLSKSEEIVQVVIIKKNNAYFEDIITLLEKKKIKFTTDFQYFNKSKNLNKLNNIDFIISVYWPYFIDMEFINKSKYTVNFHPSYLPLNRGWYPHVYNIIRGDQAGVSLHELSSKFDNGRIWFRKKVTVHIDDNASSLHERLSLQIYDLFENNWNKIKYNKIKPIQQNKTLKFNSKSDINKFDEIFLNKKYKAIDLFKRIMARNFYEKTFSYFNYQGKKYKVFLKIKKL